MSTQSLSKDRPEEIFKKFEKGELTSWGQYEHIVVCMSYALSAKNVHQLYSIMVCALIRHKSRTDISYTVERCINKFNATVTWFWCTRIFELITENQQLIHLVESAERHGYFEKNFILKYFTEEELWSDIAKAVPIQR